MAETDQDPRARQYEALRSGGLSHQQAVDRITAQGEGWGSTAADAYERARDIGLDDVAARGVVQHVFPPEPPTAPPIAARPPAPARAPAMQRSPVPAEATAQQEPATELDVEGSRERAGRFGRAFVRGAAEAVPLAATGSAGALMAATQLVDVPGSPLAQTFPTSRGAPPVAGYGGQGFRSGQAADAPSAQDITASTLVRGLLQRDPEAIGGLAGMIAGGEAAARGGPAIWRAAVQRAQSFVAGKAMAPSNPLVRAQFGDPFTTLGLDRTATAEDVEQAWKNGVARWHPDRNPAPHAGEVTSVLNAARDAARAELASRPVASAPATAASAAPAPPSAPPAPVAPAPVPAAPEPVAAPDVRTHGVGEAVGEPRPEPVDVAPAQRPRTALHDTEGNPIPGTEILPPLTDGSRAPVAAPAAAAASAPAWTPPEHTVSMATEDIQRDPVRFQYKDVGPEGVSGALKKVTVWNPDLATALHVWRDPMDGKVYVVNGHHRHELAERLEVPRMEVRFIHADSPEEARATGALVNIAEGHGTAIDAGKFMREYGATPEKLAERGISIRGDMAREGLALSRLAPDIFQQVATEKLPKGWGVAVGETLADHDMQREALSAVRGAGKRLSEAEVREVAAQVRDAGAENVQQETLFGTEEERKSLVVPKAQLVSAWRGRVSQDRRLFGFVAKEGRAEDLARAGNAINVEGSKALADQAARVEEIFERLYTRSGPVAQVLNDGARRIARGEKAGAVARELYPRVADAVAAELAGTGGVPGQGVHGSESAGPAGGAPEGGAEGDTEGVVPDSQDPDQSGLFSFNDPLQSDAFGHTTEPSQESMFGERDGAPAARTLSQTEAAARSELESLRERFSRETNPKRRAFLASQIAERERLVNRNAKISASELQARAAAGEGEQPFIAPNAAREARGKQAPPSRASSVPGDTGADRVAEDEAPPMPEPAAAASPKLPAEVGKLDELKDSVLRVMAPHVRTPDAKMTANILRAENADMKLDVARADDALRKASRAFDKANRQQIIDFMRAVESGQAVADPKMAAAAKVASAIVDHWAGEVEKLGPGHINRWIDNYWARLWKHPDRVQQWVAQQPRRPLEGKKGFKKHREFVTFEDGIRAGFEPMTWNPIDWMQAKVHELRKYLFGQRLVRDLKKHQLVTFVSSLERTPPGLTRINDAAFQAWGPPETTVWEGFDAHVRAGLQKAIADLGGVKHTRATNIGGPGMGYAIGDATIKSRFGGPDAVIMHELGHILDHRFGLWDELVPPPPTKTEKVVDAILSRGKKASRREIQAENERIRAERKRKVEERRSILNELRALADLRYEGIDPERIPDAFKDYVRERPEQIANAVHALIYAPEKMQAVAPTVRARLTAFLKGNPKLKQILDIKPSLVMTSDTAQQGLEGFVKRGEWMAPEPVARILNHHLSPGLANQPIYRGARMATGAIMQSILSLSGFHVGFVANDAAGSRWGMAVKSLADGRTNQAALDVLSGPIAPIQNLLMGHKLLRAAMDPKDPRSLVYLPIIQAAVQGGAHLFDHRQEAIDAFHRAIHEARLRPTTQGKLSEVAKASALSPFALLELTGIPIMRWYVPRMKAGLLFDMISRDLEQHPDMEPDELRERMKQIVNAVDNREGLLSRDNLHWNRVVNDLVTIMGTAPGWTIGGARAYIGGAADLAGYAGKKARGQDAELKWDAAYVLGMAAWVALTCTTLTYLLTGDRPRRFLDLFTVRDGTTNPNGDPHRISPPAYYSRDVAEAVHDPVHWAGGKINAFWGTVMGLLHNRDFRGRMIVNPDDPALAQAGQVAKHIARQGAPMSTRTNRDAPESAGEATAQFFGYRASPAWQQRSPAENMARDYLTRRGVTALTPEQAVASDERRDLLRRVREGDDDAQRELGSKLASGELTVRQWSDIQHAADEPAELRWFKPLTADEAQRVFAAASPEQQDVLRPYLDIKQAEAMSGGRRISHPRSPRARP